MNQLYITKVKDTKIIVSLGLPNVDMALNRKTEKVNILLKESLVKRKSVHICDNSNLFYRGDAQQGIRKEDGLHLSKAGKKLLARNIRMPLHDAFHIPIITYDSTEKEASKTYSPTYRNSEKEITDMKTYTETTIITDDHMVTVAGGKTIMKTMGDMRSCIWDMRGKTIMAISADTIQRDEERDSYQGYARQDDRFYNHGQRRSPRSRKDEDGDGWGHQRRS